MSLYTVSQVARRTGITIRTLHHYEAQGLLVPSRRSDAGYRLYGRDELTRLQHIVSLKALGFSLAEIRSCLDADAPSLAEALVRQVDRLRDGIVRQQNLLIRLERIAQRAAGGEAIDAETLLSSIEASTLMEKYFTSEQMQAIQQRGQELGPERIHAVEQEWPSVIAGMQTAMRLEKDPACDEVQALARRWRTLVREFTGGHSGVQQSLNTMFRENSDEMRARTGIDPQLMAYACKAIALLPTE
ncbi:MAG TPA: MerR family transcriptional regulator [Rhodanobacteraceae bacterium]|jgi:DNA-binding transcriptional MerR regulator|nr:MerR family transcriptional regulator [Rhodanobacteraceae bacterium]